MKPEIVASTHERLKEAFSNSALRQADLVKKTGIDKSSISLYLSGKVTPKGDKLYQLALALDVDPVWLSGFDVPMRSENSFQSPVIDEDYETFPVIGDLAAGYDHIAAEDWTGETINIPKSYLRGRRRDEFIVLSVSGDSMYPMYQDGDKVLILRQEIQPDRGQVCAVLYNDNLSTLKKVSWGYGGVMLEPINPMYQPIEIKGEELAHFRVIGVPRLLIREIDE